MIYRPALFQRLAPARPASAVRIARTTWARGAGRTQGRSRSSGAIPAFFVQTLDGAPRARRIGGSGHGWFSAPVSWSGRRHRRRRSRRFCSRRRWAGRRRFLRLARSRDGSQRSRQEPVPPNWLIRQRHANKAEPQARGRARKPAPAVSTGRAGGAFSREDGRGREPVVGGVQRLACSPSLSRYARSLSTCTTRRRRREPRRAVTPREASARRLAAPSFFIIGVIWVKPPPRHGAALAARDRPGRCWFWRTCAALLMWVTTDPLFTTSNVGQLPALSGKGSDRRLVGSGALRQSRWKEWPSASHSSSLSAHRCGTSWRCGRCPGLRAGAAVRPPVWAGHCPPGPAVMLIGLVWPHRDARREYGAPDR